MAKSLWQPLETALRDGTDVLLRLADGKYAWVEVAYWGSLGSRIGWIDSDGLIEDESLVTHWQPCPSTDLETSFAPTPEPAPYTVVESSPT